MNKKVLQLAIPSILANISIPLVGLVDTAILGHISDVSAIGGIAIGTMLFDLLYWNFEFLRIGTSGSVAQAFGRHNSQDCAKILTQSMSIAIASSLFIWLIQWLFVTAVLACIQCSAPVADFARRYFFIRIWAAPATLSLMAFKGWFIGMQNTVCSMICDITVNVINMVASYALAVYSPLGPIGVAYGTIIAQYSGLLVAVIILLVKYKKVFAGIRIMPIIRNIGAMRHLLQMNGNYFIRSLCFMVVYVGYTSLASRFGDTELAISSIFMKLFMLFSYLVDGFAYAGEALIGRYMGEHDHQSLSSAVNVLFIWAIGIGLLFTIIYAAWGEECISLVSNDTRLLASAHSYLGWLIAMPLVSVLAFLWDGIYVGAMADKDIRNAMILAAISFVVGYVATFSWLGVHAIFVGYFAHLLARVIYLTFNWKKYDTKINQPQVAGIEV